MIGCRRDATKWKIFIPDLIRWKKILDGLKVSYNFLFFLNFFFGEAV
jgi:hypothetical protein